MAENKGTSRAVIFAALLHLGIVGFLFLAILPCSTYEQVFGWLHLPDSWNPIACEKPVQLQGPVIEASLVGITGAPPPKASKAKPADSQQPPQPATPPPPPTPPPPTPDAVKSPLPPPPKNPDIKDQERIVEDAVEKAENAKKEQEEKEQERQAELDAAAKQKQEKLKQIDKLLAQMDKAATESKAASANAKTALTRAQQAQEQLKDLQNAKDDGLPDLPNAAQRQTGANGPDAGLLAQYQAAIQNAVTPNWQRPDNMPDVPCVVHIAQIPGGDVISANVDSNCPYDEAGRRSIENAVLRTHTLPYAGFEKVFTPRLNITFRP